MTATRGDTVRLVSNQASDSESLQRDGRGNVVVDGGMAGSSSGYEALPVSRSARAADFDLRGNWPIWAASAH
ncbi:hypothetical protein [Arthrobacter psychrolactophilus]